MVKSASCRSQRPSDNKIKVLCKYDLSAPFQVAAIGNLKKKQIRRSSSYDSNLDVPKAYSGKLAVTPFSKRYLS